MISDCRRFSAMIKNYQALFLQADGHWTMDNGYRIPFWSNFYYSSTSDDHRLQEIADQRWLILATTDVFRDD